MKHFDQMCWSNRDMHVIVNKLLDLLHYRSNKHEVDMLRHIFMVLLHSSNKKKRTLLLTNNAWFTLKLMQHKHVFLIKNDLIIVMRVLALFQTITGGHHSTE